MHSALTTDRLTLRPLRIEDAPDFARLVNNRAICRMTGTFPFPFPKPSVEGLVEIFVARAATGHSYHWAIVSQDQFVGVVGIFPKNDGWGIGYWIGEPFWGQGLAGIAVHTLICHLSDKVIDLKMTACVFTDNPASAKVLSRNGFVQDTVVCEGYSLARRSKSEHWNFTFTPNRSQSSA